MTCLRILAGHFAPATENAIRRLWITVCLSHLLIVCGGACVLVSCLLNQMFDYYPETDGFANCRAFP